MGLLLGIHLAGTWMLVGMIWVIQVVAYPQFQRVGEGEFTGYHLAHCWRIGVLIAPLLAIEAISAAGLLYQGHRERACLISIGLILVNWLCTAVLQAPLHVKLMKGYDAGTIGRLVRSNWLRTVSWTARGLLVGYVAAG